MGSRGALLGSAHHHLARHRDRGLSRYRRHPESSVGGARHDVPRRTPTARGTIRPGRSPRRLAERLRRCRVWTRRRRPPLCPRLGPRPPCTGARKWRLAGSITGAPKRLAPRSVPRRPRWRRPSRRDRRARCRRGAGLPGRTRAGRNVMALCESIAYDRIRRVRAGRLNQQIAECHAHRARPPPVPLRLCPAQPATFLADGTKIGVETSGSGCDAHPAGCRTRTLTGHRWLARTAFCRMPTVTIRTDHEPCACLRPYRPSMRSRWPTVKKMLAAGPTPEPRSKRRKRNASCWRSAANAAKEASGR